MALTTAEYIEKFRSFVPNWWFEDEDNQLAHLTGLAALFRELELSIEEHVNQTFIELADNGTLDDHGDERSTDRLTGELDSQYRIRVQSLKNQSNCPDLKQLIDQLLINGECIIQEDVAGDLFMNREAFLNRSQILVDEIINVFTVIVEDQRHEPYSFAAREYFLDRENFMGDNESSQYVFDLINEVLRKSKAEGTNYRVVELLSA